METVGLGEEINEGIFKKVGEATKTERFEGENFGDPDWNETIEHHFRWEIYSIINNDDSYMVVGGEDEARISGNWHSQYYERTDHYGNAQPVEKNGEFFLPWHVSAALTQSGKIEAVSREELVDFIEEARKIYEAGMAADEKELAQGREVYIQKKAEEWIGEGRFSGNLESAKSHIELNWHNYGPHNWSKVVSFANQYCETHVY